MKKRALVVCPGRGTYNKEELGYLSRHHQDKTEQLAFIEQYRQTVNQPSVHELDGKDRYSFKLHTLGEHASALIYACAYADFMSINQDEYEIVAITGNSMGWYIALSVAQALSPQDSITLIDTMGSMMKNGLIGSQLIYPAVGADWKIITDKKTELFTIVEEINQRAAHALYLSIDLGGYLVVAGNETGLSAFEQSVPNIDDRFPMRLYNHGAFHTPLMSQISDVGKDKLTTLDFNRPLTPLIDGRGHIWTPYSTNPQQLFDYTLGHQVTEPYYFNRAIEVGLKEFSPETIIVLGPGSSLGSSVAHSLINIGWQGISNKAEFVERQKRDPFVISMGMEAQRRFASFS
ncbi:ACP S-malonyltransferase [Litoribacillus peritrichatus]|uniref:[acyl-carrier-protein] S-malonyltransferase n=1 Tax=Litoribacillus peritrichatus TaxID=718191 RepID=A0ABP7M7W8_9GAMM